MKARRLIVNADDLGRTPGINRGVFAAHTGGIVSSATLMVSHGAAEDAVRSARHHPNLGLGLHVALTGGPPVLPPARIPDLVDASGRLPRSAPELALTTETKVQIRAEIGAQFDRFCELVGRPPSHLDSHHHAHRHREVLDCMVQVALEHGIPIRNAGPEVASQLKACGVPTTDAFIERFSGETSEDELERWLRDLPEGASELICHPGEADPLLRSTSTYAVPRERELRTLTSERVRLALREADVELITFGAL